MTKTITIHNTDYSQPSQDINSYLLKERTIKKKCREVSSTSQPPQIRRKTKLLIHHQIKLGGI